MLENASRKRFKKSDGCWPTDLLSFVTSTTQCCPLLFWWQSQSPLLNLGVKWRKNIQVTSRCATSFLYAAEKKRSLGRDYHPLCLKCQKCSRQLTAGLHAEVKKKVYQENDTLSLWIQSRSWGICCVKCAVIVSVWWETILLTLLPEDFWSAG